MQEQVPPALLCWYFKTVPFWSGSIIDAFVSKEIKDFGRDPWVTWPTVNNTHWIVNTEDSKFITSRWKFILSVGPKLQIELWLVGLNSEHINLFLKWQKMQKVFISKDLEEERNWWQRSVRLGKISLVSVLKLRFLSLNIKTETGVLRVSMSKLSSRLE